jgi:hypothetical protein
MVEYEGAFNLSYIYYTINNSIGKASAVISINTRILPADRISGRTAEA